ncbi:hypothetical protein PV325_013350 [Microctonus aethiopoides]|nr:hypothetical protein PV325_013350 [Microctonus aethiopoides]
MPGCKCELLMQRQNRDMRTTFQSRCKKTLKYLSVQSTIEAGEDFEMVQMVIEGNAANILPKVSMSEDVGVQATIENDARDVEVQVQSGELVYKFTDFIKNDAQLSTMTGIENFEILTCIENLTSILYISYQE